MQNTLREDWRAGYAETGKSGSEGSTAKPNTAMYHGRVALTLLVLPGTYFDEDAGEREALYFSRNKQVNHIELLHRSTEQTLRDLMAREVGLDWEQRYDALELVREGQRAITETTPHGKMADEQGREWEAWIGERHTDDGHAAVGYYRRFPHDPKTEQTTFKPEELDLEFRPLAKGLPHEQAATLAAWTAQSMRDHPIQNLDGMLDFISEVGALGNDKRETYLHSMAQQLAAIHEQQQPPPDLEPDDEEPSHGYNISFF